MTLDDVETLVIKRMPEFAKACKEARTRGNTVMCLFIQDFNCDGDGPLMEAAIRYACLQNVPVTMTPRRALPGDYPRSSKWNEVMPEHFLKTV